MPATQPGPRTWTLRFKRQRSTILLHVDPLQDFLTLKTELLKAIRETYPDTLLNGVTLPNKPEDILLARPVDINDLGAGWEPLEVKPPFSDDEKADGKGKGKATVASKSSKSAAGKNVFNDCPQGAGLRDGGVVAFKFRSEVEVIDEGLDEEMAVAKEDRDGMGTWDVTVPSMEETYGEAPGPDLRPRGDFGGERVEVSSSR